MARLLVASLGLLLGALVLRRRQHVPEFPVDVPGSASPADEPLREMVQDPICEAFIARAAALTTVAGGETIYFCSPACYRRFLGAAERRA